MNYKDYSFVSTSNAYFSYELHLHLFDPIVSDSYSLKQVIFCIPHYDIWMIENLVQCEASQY